MLQAFKFHRRFIFWNWRNREEGVGEKDGRLGIHCSVPLLGLSPCVEGPRVAAEKTILYILAKYSLGTRTISTTLELVEMQNLRPRHRPTRTNICIVTGSPYDRSAIKV